MVFLNNSLKIVRSLKKTLKLSNNVYISTTSFLQLERTSSLRNPTSTSTTTTPQQTPPPIPPPTLDGQNKEYSAKIQTLVDQIAKLNLIEVSDLNELLRKKLNIKDVPVNFAASAFGTSAPGGGAQGAIKKEEEKEEELPKATKSSFKVKLVKYDEAKKVPLIKEIKSCVENMNLVQAKKFVESAPQILKNDVNKEDAEKLKAQLEKVGAIIEIE